MSQDWTEKYRPKTLADVVGNPKAVGELKAWAESWNRGTPSKRAVVLMGSPGVGKTTSAEALANDMGWGIIEMNASDQRTGDAIRSVALRGAYSNTFSDTGGYLSASEGGMKLIVLDEADNFFGNADRGALPVVNELIKTTRQPVILIVNDFYALGKKSSAVKNDTLQISFIKPSVISMSKALKKVAAAEGIDISDDAVKAIAENASGDMRAGVRDLESVSMGRKQVRYEDTVELTGRVVRKSMYDLMISIFKKGDAMGSRKLLRDIDEDPNTVLLWLDENMPTEYVNQGDLIRGYGMLSRADIFLGRVSRRQYYGLWSYATDTMTAGVCTAKLTDKYGSGRYRFPTYLMKMSRSKGVRATKASVCTKLSDHLHTSTKRVSTDVIPSLKLMLMKDPELRVSMIKDVGMEAEDLAFLMNTKIDDKAVKEAIAAAIPEQAKPAKKAEPAKIVDEKKEEPVEAKPAVKPKGQKSLFEF